MKKFVFFLFCISLAVPCSAKTVTISAGGDTTIQEAIEDAHTGDIIKLKKGTYSGKGNYNINFMGRKITVRAADYDETADTIIECPKNSFAFVFESRETEKSILRGITIKGASGAEPNDPNYSDCRGGVNCLSDASPLIKDCIFTGCVTGFYAKGDPCDNTSCSPTIEGCQFTKSPKKTAKHAVWLEDCTAILDDCSIEGNTTKAGIGAGIYSLRSHLGLDSCFLNRNTATDEGGVMYIDNNNIYRTIETSEPNENDPNDPNDDTVDTSTTYTYSDNKGSLEVFNCEFSENNASAGSAIYSKITDMYVTYCQFFDNEGSCVYIDSNDNSTEPTQLYSCYFHDNISDDEIVHCKTDSLLMQSCNIYSNEAGGIYAEANDVEIYNCYVHDNLVDGKGGGIYINSDSNELSASISDCSIYENQDLNAAPIHIDSGNIMITNCYIEDNTATEDGEGGGIYISNENQSIINSNVYITGCNIYYNNNYFYDSEYGFYYHDHAFASDLPGAGIYSQVPDTTIEYCNIYENAVSGIIINADSNDGKTIVTDCYIYSNEGQGGICTDVNDVMISGCNISDNPGGGIAVNGDCNDGKLNITGSYISHNEDGDGIYSIVGNVGINDCQIMYNGGNGIAIPSDSNYGQIYVDDCYIYNNYGYLYDSNGLIIGTTGDGIYSDVNDLTVSNCDIISSANNGICLVTDSDEGQLLVTDSNIADSYFSTAIYAEVDYATLNNCNINNNGGGIYLITDNNEGNIDIVGCTIERNSDDGIYSKAGKNINISNSIIDDHQGNGIYILSNNPNAQASIIDCLITKNNATQGAGIYVSLDPNGNTQALIRNCSILGNLTNDANSGAIHLQCGQSITINSSIIRDNLTDQIAVNDETITTVEYCDIQGGWAGIGNIDEDPFFVLEGHWENSTWVNGNYHPLLGSPCIDTGDPNFTTTSDDVDLDGDPRIKWGRVDMGSDESINRILPVDPNRLGKYETIQAAVDDANVWDFIMLSPGTFEGEGNRDIDFLGKDLLLESLDTDDANIVAKTIIDCNGKWDDPHCAFYLTKGEGHPTHIEGITIKNGFGHSNFYQFALYSLGGGIYCENASTYVRKCNLIDNQAEFGGAIFGNSGTIEDCNITNNFAEMEGGGLYLCGSVARCSLTDNIANRGGAMSYCTGTISDSLISDNKAVPNQIEEEGFGGGIYACDGQIIRCDISNNKADIGGGLNLCGGTILNCNITDNNNVGVYGCDGQILSSNITGNSTDKYGAGLFDCLGDIIGCTVANNSADIIGGGIAACPGNITNSIIWANTAAGLPDQLADCSLPTYSCVQGISTGQGNIDSDPCFVNPDMGNFHLQLTSPCIDMGDPAFTATYTDIDGQDRIDGPTVDMGADEVLISPADFNIDGIVDYFDYAMFANSWGSHTGDANWCETCDANNDGVIDANDLAYMADDWLWGL